MQKLVEDVMQDQDSYHYERAMGFKVITRAIGDALKRLGIFIKESLTPLQIGNRSG